MKYKAKSKLEIKAVIQKVFNVKVISINSYILPGQSRRLGKFFGLKNSYKRVFVKILCFKKNKILYLVYKNFIK